MTRISGPGLSVLRGFIAASNEQYRKAGLGEFQMRVDSHGRVTTPRRRTPRFKPVPGTGSAASEQAAQGARVRAAPAAAPAGTATAQPAAATAAPTFTSLKPTRDGFSMTWQPVQGAAQYGIWIDGALVGHVPKPAFAGTLDAGAAGVVQVDAVLANGSRTQQTAPLGLVRDAAGKLSVRDPRTAQAPAAPAAGAATAPAAPAS